MTTHKNTGAEFDSERKHRFALWRIWDDTKPLVMFVGLNPSKANEERNDPTVTRVIAIAKQLGFGGVYMMNLFTYISTDPKKLDVLDGNHDNSNQWLVSIGNKCSAIVFAWGSFKVHGRDAEVKALFPNRFTLYINKNGSPKHPLYCKINSPLLQFP